MTENTELAATQKQNFMPVMDSEDVLMRHAALHKFRQDVMKEGVDYGAIPGTGNKPVLLKPGAEKLCTFFGLSSRLEIVEKIEDWDGREHDGEPFFYYLYRCYLSRGDMDMASADGSCNSFETKYRYRTAKRTCPKCHEETIFKSKQDGGGYYCWTKKGGCGAQFVEGDESIESQEVGLVPNAQIADQVNTLQKMAQKRALVAATLIAVNASEFFTQDMEDFAIPTPAPRTEKLATREQVKRANAAREAAIAQGYRSRDGRKPRRMTTDLSAEMVTALEKRWRDFVSARLADAVPQPTEDDQKERLAA